MAHKKRGATVGERRGHINCSVAAGFDPPVVGIASATGPFCSGAGSEVMKPSNERTTSDAVLSQRICQYERELSALQAEIARLRAENANLRERVEFFKNCPWIAAGIKGENIIAQITNCARTTGNACYDLEGYNSEGKVRIEVKISRLTTSVKGEISRQWKWNRVFGLGGKKAYDRLILVGDADPRYSQEYLDPTSPYIVFDVPFHEVANLITKGGALGRDMIQMSSNPNAKRRARGSVKLFKEYQVTYADLTSRYVWDHGTLANSGRV
jgi:hypothetical protein